ncbi:DUF5777 family beta-barrel protein [uncultured Psychroserpens sp.]|uniref:DUF5777 family beta-barrel protein n=1 Tax=uncultured Psychroserpens sp. TaxID=255436 RepID=UPI0026142D9B|nr:DUF5777 family beta-barrel protein [uncultured Psychroserpens sp.]
MKSKVIYCILFLSISAHLSSQNLLDKLANEDIETSSYVMSTFKGTRISIGHSVETRKKNTLEISFMSRYWNVPQESSNSFIADRMCTRVGLDYGISDRLTVGFGSGNPNGIFDSYLKYRLVQQSTTKKGSPIGITLLQAGTYRTRSIKGIERRTNFGEKLAFTTQVLIARKFSRNFSFQISPTFIHRTSSNFSIDDHNHFAVGFSPRYKLNNHVALVSEYYYVINPLKSLDTYGAFALGVNWEVSDLLLQFKMTNNQIFTEDAFITQTAQNFNFRDGNFYFGFHATYHIQL